ncbi:hypothetical protein B0H11DRAFT_2233371 [Mycena galericulata]|nr:hypothetical protein B0H11DRAFT_2246345 [Mycena galericulata]KAJ7480244.1 hypothetical protein B0H11DRAFT_2233371 [Mycena galericulata]
MKLTIALVSLITAAIATPAAEPSVLRAVALDARAPIDPPRCSFQLSCGGVGTDEADECGALGYICPASNAFGAPVLGAGGTANDSCTEDCVCTLFCG